MSEVKSEDFEKQNLEVVPKRPSFWIYSGTKSTNLFENSTKMEKTRKFPSRRKPKTDGTTTVYRRIASIMFCSEAVKLDFFQ